MQLRPEALAAHLEKSLSSLYILSSNELLLRQEASDAIRRAARQAGFVERHTLTVDRYFDWSQLQAAGQALSLFSERQLIELNIPTGKPGKEGGEALKKLSARQHQDILTIIILPRLDAATKKTAWFLALSQQGVSIAIDTIERHQLPVWIKQRLALQNQSVPPDEKGKQALQFIADQVEGNLLAAHQEIQKLGLLYPEGILSFETIRTAVLNTARYDVFQLGEVLLAGDTRRFMLILQGLQGEGTALPILLWAMTEEIRTLLKVHRGRQAGQSLAMLLREHRVWGPRERFVSGALERLSIDDLEHALLIAQRIDYQIKGLKPPNLPSDPWQTLLQLGCMLTGATKLEMSFK